MKENDQETEIKEAFKVFDMEETGEMSVDELRHVMRTFGDEKLTEDEIEEMVGCADNLGTGTIKYSDFIKRITAFDD
ncbi:hypothetical protein KUTeg_014208 [Tegillarca granosa]|uniref:EF-hand domain-containing protein n=1 Tax=Tegillarca granosa TaxID=220873 RepID=A0ABQ9EVX6_TEGGR|nr:hypothetical protein KUTeg_014208 [Tegillarca granosa]